VENGISRPDNQQWMKLLNPAVKCLDCRTSFPQMLRSLFYAANYWLLPVLVLTCALI